MTDLLLDLRYAFRSLIKTPGFTVVTVLVLGLGIGANTAVFSVVNAVLLQPLPVDDPDRLAVIWSNYANSTKGLVTPDDYRDIRDHNRSFQTLAAYTGLSTTLTGKEGAEMIRLSISIARPRCEVLRVVSGDSGSRRREVPAATCAQPESECVL